jgi:serine/threonine protein phosphatase 1
MRCFVIGDIHGCLDETRRLIDKLSIAPSDLLIFLGDYIDRGPDSAGVVSYLLTLQKQFPAANFIFLKGNHEDMLLSYLGLGGNHGDMFLHNGGRATLASYGVLDSNPCAAEALRQIPAAHIEFYRQLLNSFVKGSFLCVHAGVHPLKALNEQQELEMLWIRNRFIYSSHLLPYTVLFGHTPQREVYYDLPFKIGLDTGLVYGNKLTCLETEGKLLYQINRGAKVVKTIPIHERWNALSPYPTA